MTKLFDGPIPGANYTSDTKNYPWHRPPEITDMDEAIEWSWKKLTDEDAYVGLLTMFQRGMTVLQAADMFVLGAVGKGKWTVDMAALIAGPIAHIMYLMAKGYGIDVKLGIDKKKKPMTKSFYKALDAQSKIDEEKAQSVIDKIDVVKIQENAKKQQTGGLAGMVEPAPEQESTETEEV